MVGGNPVAQTVFLGSTLHFHNVLFPSPQKPPLRAHMVVGWGGSVGDRRGPRGENVSGETDRSFPVQLKHHLETQTDL